VNNGPKSAKLDITYLGSPAKKRDDKRAEGMCGLGRCVTGGRTDLVSSLVNSKKKKISAEGSRTLINTIRRKSTEKEKRGPGGRVGRTQRKEVADDMGRENSFVFDGGEGRWGGQQRRWRFYPTTLNHATADNVGKVWSDQRLHRGSYHMGFAGQESRIKQSLQFGRTRWQRD